MHEQAWNRPCSCPKSAIAAVLALMSSASEVMIASIEGDELAQAHDWCCGKRSRCCDRIVLACGPGQVWRRWASAALAVSRRVKMNKEPERIDENACVRPIGVRSICPVA